MTLTKTAQMLALCLFVVPGLVRAATPATPKALTDEVVQTFRRLNDPATPESERTGPHAFASIDALFDFDTLSRSAVESHKKALKPKQQAELQNTFRALVTQLTHRSGEQLVNGEVTLKAPQPRGKDCVVAFEVFRPEDDATSEVALTWRKQPAGWRVVDVALDGASIAKDYENQFGRIIKKSGAQVLIDKMKERLAAAQKNVP